MRHATIYVGDACEVLRALPAESIHCCVCSPPYWRQRDYGNGAGQLGMEATPEVYIEALVAIFREVRRVLRVEGTCWVNLGDKWASGGNGGGGSFMEERGEAWAHNKDAKGWRSPPSGYKDKDLVGLPFMLAFALRADGWFWRQCNVWAKPNCMPESVRDRSTSSHEYVLQFSKRNDYYYNADAARTPGEPASETRLAHRAYSDRAYGGSRANRPMKAVAKQRGHSRRHQGFNERWDNMECVDQIAAGANLRSVWWIASAQFREAHFAVMPERLAEMCIAAGCPEGGVVLDPFGGTGTTGLVALRAGRDAVLVELNPDYVELARKRIVEDAPMFNRVDIG